MCSEGFDRVVQLQFALVDFDTVLCLHRFSNVLCGDRAVNFAVSTGCGVILSRAEFNGQPQKIETLQIVGRSEADYDKHKISDDSPIGKAVLGKRVGDTFIVEAPVGIMTFTVLEISSTGVFENQPEG